MTGHEQETDVRDSTPGSNGPEGAAGGMGVSSERVGDAGAGVVSTDGVRDTSEPTPEEVSGDAEPDAAVPPEQHVGGGDEINSGGRQAVAGYPSRDPRSQDAPYKDA